MSFRNFVLRTTAELDLFQTVAITALSHLVAGNEPITPETVEAVYGRCVELIQAERDLATRDSANSLGIPLTYTHVTVDMVNQARKSSQSVRL